MASIVENQVTPAAAPAAGTARSRPWLTELGLLLMAALWGVNFAIVKFGTEVLAPLAFNAARVVLAAVVLAAIAFPSAARRPSRRDAMALVLLGVLGNFAYQLLFIEGIARTRAGDAALVIAATPAFIAIIGWLRGSERVGPRGVLGIALSIGGIGLVVFGNAAARAGESTLLGNLLVLAAAVCWSLYTVLSRPYTARVDGVQLSAYTMLGGAIPLTLVALPALLATRWETVALPAWGAVVYSGVGSMVLAYLLWYRGVREIGPTRTAMYANLQPLIALAVAWMALGETPTIWQAVGAACIMTGLLLTRSRGGS